MSRWFRLYDELLDDPKAQRLDGETFKTWVNLLCLANRNGGRLPSITDIAFALRIDEHGARTVVERLLNGGLIDRVSGGADGYGYAPHGWEKRQFKSDTSSERVKRYRERSKKVTETPPEQKQIQSNPLPPKNGGGPALARDGKPYAFAGKTIRLNEQDLAAWRGRFHAIPDIVAELWALDGWLERQEPNVRKDWFHRISGALNRKHQELLAKAESTAGSDDKLIRNILARKAREEANALAKGGC